MIDAAARTIPSAGRQPAPATSSRPTGRRHLDTGAGTSGIVLEQNLIGTDVTGTNALANTLSSVQIHGRAADGGISTAGGLTTPAGVFHGFDFAVRNIAAPDPAG